MAVIISVVNNKGGVGKTTVTCNLAHSLALLDQRVLVVDLDSQCNATALLLPKKLTVRHSLYEVIALDKLEHPLKGFLYPTRYNGVFCLPNVPETASLEPQVILGAPDSFSRLRRHLRNYALKNFDFTVIDNPPNLGTFVMCALATSDFALIPVKAGSAFSMEGLLKAVRLINEVRGQNNKNLRLLRLLVNQVDKRTVISRTLVDHLAGAFREDQIFHTTIPVNTAFEQAEAAGTTILHYNTSAPGARAFRDLARELLDIFALETASERRAIS
jgi:cellulose biosynthesis protein BcsQ